MKNIILYIIVILFGGIYALANFNKNLTANPIYFDQVSGKPILNLTTIYINDAVISVFFKKYPKLKTYRVDVSALYKARKYKPIWYNNKNLIAFANLLYYKVNHLEEEGLESSFANTVEVDEIFRGENLKNISQQKKIIGMI